MNWDLQANVSLRKGPQEQFKKLVRNKGQKAVEQKHSRLLKAGDSFSQGGFIPTCQSPHPTGNVSFSQERRRVGKRLI